MMNGNKNLDLKHSELWIAYWKDRDSAEAINHLMEVWMPLVESVLRKITICLPSYIQVEDLFQSASVGLFESIERFDPDYGVSFGGYAYHRIRGAIMDELRNSDHLSRSGRAKVNRIEKAIQKLTIEKGRLPDEKELADLLKMSQSEIALTMEMAQCQLSLDQVVMLDKGGKEVFLRDILADSECLTPDIAAEREDIRSFLRRAFRQLSQREQKILYLYYFEDLRLSEIAALFDVTEARISQIHALSMIKLKVAMGTFERVVSTH